MKNRLILEILAIGLVVTALLAVNVDDPIYSVISLACVFVITSLLYLVNGAYYAAIFQFVIGIGTLAILFVTAETLDETRFEKKPSKFPIGTIVAALILVVPVIFLTIPVIRIIPEPAGNLPYVLWDLRSIDVILQGIIMLVIAIGMIILLKNEREADR